MPLSQTVLWLRCQSQGDPKSQYWRATVRPMDTPSNPVQTTTNARPGSWMVQLAAGAPWLVGFVSIFLVAPTNAGMGTWSAYASFQPGSNFGNVLALALWSCAALSSGWLCSRWSARTSVRVLCAYGVPAVLSLYPAAAVSNAVSHVMAIEDTFTYRDGLAGPLVVSGLGALAAALICGISAHRHGT